MNDSNFRRSIAGTIKKSILKKLTRGENPFPITKKEVIDHVLYYFGKNLNDTDRENLKYATKTVIRKEYKKYKQKLDRVKNSVTFVLNSDEIDTNELRDIIIYFQILSLQRDHSITKNFIIEQSKALNILIPNFINYVKK